MILDIIIPCLNEAHNLTSLLPYLTSSSSIGRINILIVDAAKSNDSSQLICEKYKVNYLRSNDTQRSIQMNLGAQHLTGDALLFLHADVKPPLDYYILISKAIKNGYESGCFAYRFDSNKKILQLNAFFTRFNGFYTGGGDQALFITKKCFNHIDGFCNHHVIMEDFDLYKRIRSKKINYKIIKSRAIVSARKYDHNSWLKVNLINLIALLQYKVDRDPKSIKSFYKKWIST